MKPRSLFLDWNGVVVDDEDHHFRSLAGTLAARGIEITREMYWERYLVLDDRRAIVAALDDARQKASALEVERIVREKSRRYEALVGAEPPFFPGAIEAIRRAVARCPVCVVSGAARGEIEAAVAAAKIGREISFVIAAEETEAGKPDPAPYREAIERMRRIVPNLLSEEGIAVEDTPGGIRSARGAGLRVLGVATTYPRERLLAPLAEADGVLDSIADLDLERLPI